MQDARWRKRERGKSRARKGLYRQHLPSSFSEENSQISAVGHEPYIPYLNLEITAIAMDRPKEEREARAMGMMMYQASRGFAKSSFLMQLNQNIWTSLRKGTRWTILKSSELGEVRRLPLFWFEVMESLRRSHDDGRINDKYASSRYTRAGWVVCAV